MKKKKARQDHIIAWLQGMYCLIGISKDIGLWDVTDLTDLIRQLFS